ncbi:MAG: hypothetical protein IAB80_09715 [Bacteroidetes bacterium]|uniref:Uncharacterized protein n=1 Tax=Candidatus Cryptobacteroides excrementipullorum TaxID=2840761 RepID=A0A9D9IUB0_9BACT|nr:hypothetical protein [Candidatus Cryptobacteroides excrementipullorum]
MEAEKTYQNKVPRTIQQKRGGEGALEFADNRFDLQLNHLICSVIQREKNRHNKKKESLKLSRKRTSAILNRGVDSMTRRVASGAGVSAISGQANDPIVSERTNTMWQNMLREHNVTQQETWDIRNCAEAHLWLKLVDRNILPRNVSIVVGQYNSKGKVRGDRPCRNCQQWVHKEFRSITGHI